MKKNFQSSLLALSMCLVTACNSSPDNERSTHSHSAYSAMSHNAAVDPPNNEVNPPLPEPPSVSLPIADDKEKTFAVHSRESTLTAEINSFGETKILDYPTEWRGKAKITRYDGPAASPFSPEHCLEIRKLAETGGGLFTRNAHHSLVEFSMPFFLTYEFNSTVVEAAEAAGLSTMNLEILNPAQIASNGTLELRFKDNAISPKNGDLDYLYEQLHFRYKGIDEGDRRILTVFSGDILCDLAEGNVEVIMEYPIKGEERTVKIIYGDLDVGEFK